MCGSCVCCSCSSRLTAHDLFFKNSRRAILFFLVNFLYALCFFLHSLCFSLSGTLNSPLLVNDADDLPDGGATHFANCIKQIRKSSPNTTIEILTPDFLKKEGAIEIVVEAKPDVFNHNIETVPSLYKRIRPGARYFHSLNLLYKVKKLDPTIFTKSGIMVGLGENNAEITQVMDDLRAADVDFITIGQYLQPTKKHAEIARYVTPEEFKYFERLARTKGFLMVSASPLTRSSYHAGDDFKIMKQARSVVTQA